MEYLTSTYAYIGYGLVIALTLPAIGIFVCRLATIVPSMLWESLVDYAETMVEMAKTRTRVLAGK